MCFFKNKISFLKVFLSTNFAFKLTKHFGSKIYIPTFKVMCANILPHPKVFNKSHSLLSRGCFRCNLGNSGFLFRRPKKLRLPSKETLMSLLYSRIRARVRKPFLVMTPPFALIWESSSGLLCLLHGFEESNHLFCRMSVALGWFDVPL